MIKMEVLQQYTKEDLEKRLSVIKENGNHVKKCLDYALDKLVIYHNEGAKGLIVDEAFFDVYAKMQAALKSYEGYNERITKKINAKLEDLNYKEKERSSSVPRRSFN